MGLQLSYLGTIGIILFHKNIKQYFDNIKRLKNSIIIKKNKHVSKVIENLKDIISVTLSAQIMLLPVLLYHFNMIGIYFLIANILVSIIIGPIMALSILFIISAFIHSEISNFISIFLSIGIQGLIEISNLANLPFSKIYVATPNLVSIIIYYIVIFVSNQLYVIYTSKYLSPTQKREKNIIALIKYKLYQKKRKFAKAYKEFWKQDRNKKNTDVKKNLKSLILKTYKIIILLISVIVIFQFNKKLEICFLDVGQGDACFITTPNHKTILIDGGGSSSSTFDVGKDTLIPYILDKGHIKVDYIFISHFDQDHIGGILTVLEELRVGEIYITKQGEESENYKKFLEIVEQKNLHVKVVKAGDIVLIDDISFHILWSTEEMIEENILNNNAMVMKMQYKNFSMLFTGDIEEIAEREILNLYKNNSNVLQATILKVAHHGSKTSSTEEFLKAVKSKVALIGVGENNMFGHPNAEVLKRLEAFRHANS